MNIEHVYKIKELKSCILWRATCFFFLGYRLKKIIIEQRSKQSYFLTMAALFHSFLPLKSNYMSVSIIVCFHADE